MTEIRLDLMVKGKKRTYTQDFVPYRKALDYSEGEAKLWKKQGNKTIEPSAIDLAKYRADFVAGLFEDQDLTGDMIIDGIDSENKDVIMDIVLYRVLGYEKPTEDEVETDPKAEI